MDKAAAVEIISSFRNALESKGIQVDKIILFGSMADGSYSKNSDIDVFVVSDSFSGKDYWQRIEMLSDAIYDIFQPIDAIAMTNEEWSSGNSFTRALGNKGEIVFAA